MRTPARFKGETNYIASQDKKANRTLPCMAQVGDGTGGNPVVANRANFYWIQLYGDTNRVTQCFCSFILTNGDIIYVQRARDRNLSYYEFVEFIQTAGGGSTVAPVPVHNHGGATQGGQLDWDDIWTDAVHTHANAAEGGQLDWDDIWSDAAHDHSSAAEGGQLIDLNGAADALVLDADGNTTISAPINDQIDFEVGGADTVQFGVGGAGNVNVLNGLTTLRRAAAGALYVEAEDAATNTVSSVATLYHDSTNVPAVGFGGRLLWELKDTVGKEEAIAIDGVWDDPIGGTEDAHMAFLVAINSVLTEIARVDEDGIELVAGADVYPEADGGGLFQRAPNHWRTPTDHFNAFAGYVWAAYAPFDGAPSTVDVATYPSLLRLMNDDTTEDHYAYASGHDTWIYARLTKGVDSYVGIRLQDSGNDNNDFVELRLIDGTTTGFFAIEIEYDTGGLGPVGPTTLVDDIEPAFYLLQLWKIDATIYAFYTMDTPVPILIGDTGATITWTPDRAGVVFGQRGFASSATRVGLVDFVEMT